jgi:subtilisin-like proprotein convertase family protein
MNVVAIPDNEPAADSFDGESPTGEWALSVSDHAAQDIGELESWSIQF